MKRAKHTAALLVLLLLNSSLSGQKNLETGYSNLDKALQKDFESKFAFTVVIGDEEKVLFSKAYGHIDLLNKIATNETTLFNIASVSKSFTSIGILHLVEQNKLKLSDSLGKFFKNAPTDKRVITISQLLCHKSGFQQNFVCDGQQNPTGALKALLTDTLGSMPGTSFDYSNENFEMLALVIEKISNLTYEEFIKKEILTPLGLKNTFFWDEVRRLPNVAKKNRELSDSITK